MFKGLTTILIGFLVAITGLVVSTVCALLDVFGAIELSMESHLAILGTGLATCVVLLIIGGTIHVWAMLR